MVLDVLADSQDRAGRASEEGEIELGQYPPSYKLRHADKDLRLVVDEAALARRDLRVAMAARSWMEEAETLGAADLDLSAVVAAIVGEEPVSDGNGAHGPGRER